MNPLEIFSQPAWQKLGWTLVHFLWQGALIALLAAAVASALKLRRGNPRYALYLGAFLLMAACPVATFFLLDVGPAVAKARRVPAQDLGTPDVGAGLGEMEVLPPTPEGSWDTAALASSNAEWAATLARTIEPALPYFLALWLLGVGAMSLRLTLGFAALHRLRRSARPLPLDLADRFRTLARRCGLPRFTRACISPEVREPLALGLLRPMILLPVSMLTDLPPAAVEAVLAHELAHIRRHDLWVNLFQRVVEALLFFHPAVWWLSNRIREEREICCDAAAVRVTGEPLGYAQTLERVATNMIGRLPHLAAALGSRRTLLIERVRHILSSPSASRRPAGWSAGLVSLVAVSVIVVACARHAARKENPGTAERLRYTGRVIDLQTGQGIPGVTVVVSRSIETPAVRRVLQETRHITDADGGYSFRVPLEQVSEPDLYLEFDVTHPDYAAMTGKGYGLTAIRREEARGSRPFFETIRLETGGKVSGRVVDPEGKPLAGTSISGFSSSNYQERGGSFIKTTSLADGRFSITLTKKGPGLLWITDDRYAPIQVEVGEPRGDLGDFQLKRGYALEGRVVDLEGRGVSGVKVQAEGAAGLRTEATRELPVGGQTERTAETDSEGSFRLAPLPGGNVKVAVVESLADDGRFQPPPGVFLPVELTLDENSAKQPVTVTESPSVRISGRYVDSEGKATRGSWAPFHCQVQRGFYQTWGRADDEGRFVILAPRGGTNATFQLLPEGDAVMAYRLGKDGTVRTGYAIHLGDLRSDIEDLQIIRYRAPVVVVEAVDDDGRPVPGAQVEARYLNMEVDWPPAFRKQPDGSFQSKQIMPGQKAVVIAFAEGHQTVEREVTVNEGREARLKLVLRPSTPGAPERPPEDEPQPAIDSADGRESTVTLHRYFRLLQGQNDTPEARQKMIGLANQLVSRVQRRAGEAKTAYSTALANEADSYLLASIARTFGRWRAAEARQVLNAVVAKNHPAHPVARTTAVWALGMIHEDKPADPELVKLLIERLFDQNPLDPEAFEVRLHSAVALGRMKAVEAVDELENRYHNDGVQIRAVARWAIERMTDRELPPVEGIEPVGDDSPLLNPPGAE